MAWLAVDKDGVCTIFKDKPHRVKNPVASDYWNSDSKYCIVDDDIIEIILGRELTWEDEPVEITNL